MSTVHHNLSAYHANSIPDAKDMTFGIVVSEWNNNITNALLEGVVETLKKHGAEEENIQIEKVPGSFELIYGANQMANCYELDAVIVLGCVIRGETPHFDYVCMGVTQGIAQLNATGDIPVIYGLITANTMKQALERCGGIHGNKGVECAITAIKMINIFGD
ncbi:MAG: 7-dimethyl-8-ribityllumazine synthase [Candidatus Ordinivivax streblomastigis]|uniref:6,7-dimethyl-8-ribityllumazine synthase n=1 Tax=Candidatus Ordinivivax streblomastigis TaxID=2540710 RepID=A0A5M8NTM6_9BACT|nr:MAG: 7-dimethyl-8-ribityllumazine synthase [Candidatus Ordinivivax streblomastigis]